VCGLGSKALFAFARLASKLMIGRNASALTRAMYTQAARPSANSTTATIAV
jgi:hypothetical protein